MDSALNNLQWLMCHKAKLKQTKPVSVTLFNGTATFWGIYRTVIVLFNLVELFNAEVSIFSVIYIVLVN